MPLLAVALASAARVVLTGPAIAGQYISALAAARALARGGGGLARPHNEPGAHRRGHDGAAHTP